MSKKAILTIENIEPEREVVTVFGKDYELLDYEDMGLVPYSKFLKKYTAIGEQAAKASELSDEEFGAFESALNDMVCTVLIGITKEEAAKIRLEQKQKVVACFFTIATRILIAKNTEAKKESPTTTET